MSCVNILLDVESLCIVLEKCDGLSGQLLTFLVFCLQQSLSYKYTLSVKNSHCFGSAVGSVQHTPTRIK